MLTLFASRPERVTVAKLPDRTLLVTLNDNIRQLEAAPADTAGEVWEADQYSITIPALPGVEGRIENDFDAWLGRAKKETARVPSEMEQLRADTDFLLTMGGYV